MDARERLKPACILGRIQILAQQKAQFAPEDQAAQPLQRAAVAQCSSQPVSSMRQGAALVFVPEPSDNWKTV